MTGRTAAPPTTILREHGPRPRRTRAIFISLRNRLAIVFFVITLLAIGVLYLYVAPGLRTRLLDARLQSLAKDAHRYASQILPPIGSSARTSQTVDTIANASSFRVTLLKVYGHGPAVLSQIADSTHAPPSTQLGLRVGVRALRTGAPRRGTELTPHGLVAEAAVPIRQGSRIVGVLVFSAPAADVVQSVALVRDQILIAGGIALLLALVGGYLTARWLAARVKRLERAAERVAAGEFGEPIEVDSPDELGQLATAFNEMQRQLGQLERARKQFIATASHELRTPVFSLGGFVELLEDEELDGATRRRFLGHVAEQVERLRKLSVDLLDLSRLESGSLELRPELVDLAELTRSVTAEFEVSLAQHESELELRMAPRVEAVCDPVRLAQIVRILVDNAVGHTPAGTRIVITTDRENGRVRLAVRDNGTGIDQTALPRIFEPFFTADDQQGSGLGLAIASELAERMDGRLRVETAPSATVFTLELPANA